MIPRMDPTLFDWHTWRNGSIADLKIPCRFKSITSVLHASTLREHAVGYCPGERLKCRPKVNEDAVMMYLNGEHFWFHLRRPEFELVFGQPLEEIGFYTLEDKRVLGLGHNSPMWRTELILSNKCNFKCAYCRGPSSYFKDDISLENIYFTLDNWIKDDLRNLRLSGGEPTLHPNLLEIVKHASDNQVNRIAISTNGSATLDYYKKLIDNGVNDFSVSLDACCSEDIDKMTGVHGYSERIISNIRELSKLTYVTIGMVINEANRNNIVEKINFAKDLGVADVRIIPSAQYNELIRELSDFNTDEINLPILKYRINNTKKEVNIRGLDYNDSNRCYLAIDDSIVAGENHFPCPAYMREHGKPIGKIGPNMRKERIEWSKNHDTHNDPICSKNCLDICRQHNNRCQKLRGDL